MEIFIRELTSNDSYKLPDLYSKYRFHYLSEPDTTAKKVCNRLRIQYIFDKPLSRLGLGTLVGAIAQGDNGDILGTVIARRRNPFKEIWRLTLVIVHPDYRRLGIATRMVNFVINRLREKKAKELIVTVAKDSVASRLFHRTGFKCLEPLFEAYGSTQDLTIEAEKCPLLQDVDINVKRVSGRPPTEDFLGFWFQKIVSVFLSVFFEEFPVVETFAVVAGGKMIGFVKVDNSIFRDTAIVKEIYLHPQFTAKVVVKEILKMILKIFREAGTEKVRVRVNRLLFRDILVELNLKINPVSNIMSKSL